MKRDDLINVKYIGASRLKSLNASGIHTVRQLCETPEEKLAGISTIGKHYAGLIRASAEKIYGKMPEHKDIGALSANEKEAAGALKPEPDKKIRDLKRHLKLVCNDLKSLKKGSGKELHSEFRKRSGKLINRLKESTGQLKDIREKIPEDVIGKIDALNSMAKNAAKDLRKKNIKKIFREMKSFSKMLKKKEG